LKSKSYFLRENDFISKTIKIDFKSQLFVLNKIICQLLLVKNRKYMQLTHITHRMKVYTLHFNTISQINASFCCNNTNINAITKSFDLTAYPTLIKSTVISRSHRMKVKKSIRVRRIFLFWVYFWSTHITTVCHLFGEENRPSRSMSKTYKKQCLLQVNLAF